METALTANMTNIPRAEKLSIAAKIHDNLRDRKKKGPSEPSLDAFISELAAVIDALRTHTTGHRLADAAHQARIGRTEAAEIEFDTWRCHIESFLYIEAHRRGGPNVGVAQSLYNAVYPDGKPHVDDRIIDVSTHCRDILAVLKAPENADAIARVALPPSWIIRFEAALDESDAAAADMMSRDQSGPQLGTGRDATLAWLDLMVRLRRYVARRATRGDAERMNEGKALLKPLLDALIKRRAASAMATRRAGRLGPPSSSSSPYLPIL
jgi:hypothetical protein